MVQASQEMAHQLSATCASQGLLPALATIGPFGPDDTHDNGLDYAGFTRSFLALMGKRCSDNSHLEVDKHLQQRESTLNISTGESSFGTPQDQVVMSKHWLIQLRTRQTSAAGLTIRATLFDGYGWEQQGRVAWPCSRLPDHSRVYLESSAVLAIAVERAVNMSSEYFFHLRSVDYLTQDKIQITCSFDSPSPLPLSQGSDEGSQQAGSPLGAFRPFRKLLSERHLRSASASPDQPALVHAQQNPIRAGAATKSRAVNGADGSHKSVVGTGVHRPVDTKHDVSSAGHSQRSAPTRIRSHSRSGLHLESSSAAHAVLRPSLHHFPHVSSHHAHSSVLPIILLVGGAGAAFACVTLMLCRCLWLRCGGQFGHGRQRLTHAADGLSPSYPRTPRMHTAQQPGGCGIHPLDFSRCRCAMDGSPQYSASPVFASECARRPPSPTATELSLYGAVPFDPPLSVINGAMSNVSRATRVCTMGAASLAEPGLPKLSEHNYESE